MDFSTVLASGVVSALIAGLVSLRTSERKIQIENITQERAKWREKIRSNALLVQQAAAAHDRAKVKELHGVFQLLLNPLDDEDNDLLRSIDAMSTIDRPEPRLAEFLARVALLLKHDWERAKREAKPWFLRRDVKRTPFK
jgi:hypothetical protein